MREDDSNNSRSGDKRLARVLGERGEDCVTYYGSARDDERRGRRLLAQLQRSIAQAAWRARGKRKQQKQRQPQRGKR